MSNSDDILNATCTEIAGRINAGHQWLTIAPTGVDDTAVALVVDVCGHFAAVSESESPQAIASTISDLFHAMAEHVRRESVEISNKADELLASAAQMRQNLD